jgi:hypothetical protein
VSAGKRPAPTSATSAASTKLDLKPSGAKAEADLHQTTKHTTLSVSK